MRVTLAFVFLFGSVFAVFAQGTTSLPTVALCEAEAGTCINSAQTYMNALVVQALPAEQFSQSLADYVIALAALAQANAECNLIDSEIAQAISLAASYAIDPDQGAQLVTIGETIGACENFATAAIDPVASAN